MHSNRAAGKLAGCQTVAGRKRLQVSAGKPAKLHVDLVALGMKNSTASSVYSAFRSVVSTRRGDTQTAEISTKTKCGVLEL
jgi:hypothetical protein